MSTPTDTFLHEAREILEALEENLLELEAEPESQSAVDTVFRGLHTLKGSGEMFGYSALAAFVHHFENAYELVRSGKAKVTPELVTLSLTSRDHLAALLAAGTDPAEVSALTGSDIHHDLLAQIQTFVDADDTAGEPAEVAPSEEQSSGPRKYRVLFKPEANALRFGMQSDLLITELLEMGQGTSVCLVGDVPPLDAIEPADCYLAWQVELETSEPRSKLEEVFIFADDAFLTITEIDPPATTPVTAPASASKDSAAAPAAPVERGVPKPQALDSIRVQSHRLDQLMDQLGELVIAQARLNRLSTQLVDPSLSCAAEEIERLVTGLRDATLSIRMLPIGTVFGKFRRVVRDLSQELGKQVRLDFEGGQTELDKTIIDSLSEPLVHIIRNSVDHGIENAETRAEAGKPAEATLLLSARQSGGEVLVSVTDDGGGLNTDVIRQRAAERGLIDADADITDEEIHQLIFAPGFSTAKVVSSVSGRGVGMDAVRTVIEKLRGAVEVQSKAGQGTEVTLRLPLTLAIIDGLMVGLGDAVYVLPLASVEECVELSVDASTDDSGRSVMNIRDQLVPYLNVEELFGFEPSDVGFRRVVIVSSDGRRVGLVVDDVIGQHQTVIKPLSIFHRHVAGVAGGTILGDGSVALIIDPVALIKNHEAKVREAA